MVLQILTYTHHITTMLFGIFLSAFFLGVKQDKKNILQLLSLAVVSGILYVLCVLLFGTETVDQIYPLIVHAPLLFVLVLHYKFRILPSLISIFTAYLCCQCSNWMGLFALFVTGQELLCLQNPGDHWRFCHFVQVCLSDDSNAVCQDRQGTSYYRKSAHGILYF